MLIEGGGNTPVSIFFCTFACLYKYWQQLAQQLTIVGKSINIFLITVSGMKNLGRKALLLFLILLTGNIISAKAQNIAVKNNILYDASTTPNFGIELRLSNKWTAGINVALNPWSFSDNKKLKHLLVAPQLRYWLCASF